MVAALERNGFLQDHDAVLTGYLPTSEHVDFAARLIDRMRGTGKARVVVDPVMGDEPKGLYIDAAAAKRIRDTLVPRADILTPNAFERRWIGAAASLVPRIIVTSHGGTRAETGVLDLSQGAAVRYGVERLDGVPQGTGDVLAALIAVGVPVGQALGHLQALIAESLGAPHLRIAEAAPVWTRAAPLEGEPYGL
ncbi:bifunctional hydroxymethylpyrimidine kinase/phosphomethylpyrimidine kinase [Sagittula stellata]|uniref:pyridoxal kinase n=1 Tax=Sagittula stellata (strain ATCC 700073 / DSM 11524 / E-37) TaxID=388399 RepID=A3K5K2_SAGS3|nr:bifunctional hydroxymethylpyrimidine kinase/phosphomethylpyrimidine kinase [Sagittula stellata]EBA07391.1 pyridoxine kinase [Sagittula stellata E-37]